MMSRLQEIFARRIFKIQKNCDEFENDGKNAKNILDFDAKVRGKMFGFKSGHMLYRKISCNVISTLISISNPFESNIPGKSTR